MGLTNLEELDLSSNFLTEVPADALRDLSKLRTLVLHDNLIQVCVRERSGEERKLRRKRRVEKRGKA